MADPKTNALAVLGGMKNSISSYAKQSKYADQALGEGIAAPFAVIGYKGARWSIRHRGNVTVLQRYDAQNRPDGFVPYLDLVVLFAASHHSKVYYEKAYVDGSDDMPDCWSTDGVKPDNAASKKQSPTCGNCKWNEFGSRTNQATGARGKACADTRRMAVVPYRDIENSVLGGPMLLRVPPASLAAVGEYSDLLKANSVPYSAICTRVGFDPKEAFPKMTFEPFAALTDDEMRKVIEMQNHPLVERIVQEQLENVNAQVGSEQGVNKPVTPDSSKANGAEVPPAKSEFAQAQTKADGPSYAGRPQEPATAPPAPAEPEAQATPPTDQAATAAAQAQALTPDQIRIKELEAKLAAAEAKPQKRRTKPVAPQAEAQTHAGPPLPAPVGPGEPEGEEDGSGSGAMVPAGDPALASISARLSKILS